jgi:hypothetical protein
VDISKYLSIYPSVYSPHTTYYILHTIHYTLYTTNFILHTIYCTLYTTHHALCDVTARDEAPALLARQHNTLSVPNTETAATSTANIDAIITDLAILKTVYRRIRGGQRLLRPVRPSRSPRLASPPLGSPETGTGTARDHCSFVLWTLDFGPMHHSLTHSLTHTILTTHSLTQY